MRQAATILLSAIVAIHCSASTTSPDTRDDEANATNGAPRTEPKPQVDPPTPPEVEATPEENVLVTSRAVGDDGATYVTGTFSGKLLLGQRKFLSRGADDVFLTRVEPDGTIAWAITIGSERNERAPNVTFEEGRVKLIALTRGEVDCGAGPMAVWSSAMFFYCAFGAEEGEMLLGLTMPTGEP
jgi:hypothetical protein